MGGISETIEVAILADRYAVQGFHETVQTHLQTLLSWDESVAKALLQSSLLTKPNPYRRAIEAAVVQAAVSAAAVDFDAAYGPKLDTILQHLDTYNNGKAVWTKMWLLRGLSERLVGEVTAGRSSSELTNVREKSMLLRLHNLMFKALKDWEEFTDIEHPIKRRKTNEY